MADEQRLLAVIPARGGSKGLPGKNIRPMMGLPLIAHSILLARMCPGIDRCIISTDSEEIAEVSREFNADVPFLRPAELAEDNVAMLPVLQHALAFVEKEEGQPYDMLLLLDPTSPSRLPEHVAGAKQQLVDTPTADGVIGVSEPEFNPIWQCVVDRDGWMADLVEGANTFERRQDVPPVYRINGCLYLWRTGYLRNQQGSWRSTDKHVMYEQPNLQSVSFDNLFEFERAELLIKNGYIDFPWLNDSGR